MVPTISILVPVYNVEKYLDQCLSSICSQTMNNLEIIIINDGSKDGSLEIANKYALNDERIVIINKENSGYGDSMNKGLEYATGKYVGIVESDDWIEKDMFEFLFNMCEKDNLDIARSEFFEYKPSQHIDKPTKTEFVKHNCVFAPRNEFSVFYQQPSIWANLYRRSFLVKNNINFLNTPGASYQDTSFSFKVYACADNFKMTNRAFYHYRTDGASSSFQNKTNVFCVCDEYAEIWRYVRDNNLYEQYKLLIPHLQFRGYLWNYNRLIKPHDLLFFKKWNEEFIQEYNNGLIDLSTFPEDEANILADVLKNYPPLKNGQSTLSIIIPVYNVQKYLEKCLDSVINQTYRNLEIICINDGSKDDSKTILNEYSKKDERIIVIDKNNGGLSSARNVGLEVATGEYICFLDSDDWVNPDAYEKALSKISGVDVVVFGTKVIEEKGIKHNPSDDEYYRIKYSGKTKLTDEILLNTDVSAWDKIYRSSIIKNNNFHFPLGKLYEDYSFYWHYMLKCDSAYFIQTQHHNYLRRSGSIMANTFSGIPRAIEHMEIMEEIFKDVATYDGWQGRENTLNRIFLNCFWFAYLNVPENNRNRVLKLGTEQVFRMNLSGEPIIDSLRRKDYSSIVNTKFRSRKKLLGKLLFVYQKFTGLETEKLRSVLDSELLSPECQENKVVTAFWLHQHEDRFNEKRWNIIYDRNSDHEDLTWGITGGLMGGSLIKSDYLGTHMQHGGEYRIHISLFSTESAIIEGIALNGERAIFGTTIFDGITIFTASADFNIKNHSVQIYAVDPIVKVDYSKECRIETIERRI